VTPDRCGKVNVGGLGIFGYLGSLTEAPVNVSGNYNRSKVNYIALVKFDQMLEHPSISRYARA